MPAGVSDYGADTWLQALFGVISLPTTYYIALNLEEPGPGMDGDILADLEPTDSAYARVSYGSGATNWATNSGFITNLNQIEFALPTVDWGYISHYTLCTAITSGSIYAWGEFLNAQYVTADYQMLIPPGGLVLTLSALDNSIAV